MSIGYINGRYVSLAELVIPIEERGHQFGDGIYEVIRFYNGKGFMIDEHLDRLMNSAKAINLPLKDDAIGYKRLILEAFERSGLTDASVYIQITRGFAPRNHLFPDVPVSVAMTVKPVTPIALEVRDNGVSTIFHEDERWANCYIKSLNLLPNILARQAAHESGCYEAVLVRDGYVTEGTLSNVYMIKNNKVYTTPLSKHILSGITRMAVKKICHQTNVEFVEEQVTKEEFIQADEAFLTSTTSEILPIVSVEGQTIGAGKPGELTKQLYHSFQQMLL